jgi:hypothetical protein
VLAGGAGATGVVAIGTFEISFTSELEALFVFSVGFEDFWVLATFEACLLDVQPISNYIANCCLFDITM